MTSCEFYSPWVIVIGFDTRWLLHDFLWFLFTMSDCYWSRHTMISAWPLVISIHHEWLLLVSTHGDWCMSSLDFYSPWVIVIGFDTRWLLHDFLWYLFTMSDSYWFLHTMNFAWPDFYSPWVIVIGFYTRWFSKECETKYLYYLYCDHIIIIFTKIIVIVHITQREWSVNHGRCL